MQNIITLPVTARMELQPDGHYKMVTAELAEIPVDILVRMLYPAYMADMVRTDQSTAGKESLEEVE